MSVGFIIGTSDELPDGSRGVVPQEGLEAAVRVQLRQESRFRHGERDHGDRRQFDRGRHGLGETF